MADAFKNGTFPFYHVELDEEYQPLLVKDRQIADVIGNKVTLDRVYRLLVDNFHMDSLAVESCMIVVINCHGKVTGIFEISRGAQDHVEVPVDEVFRGALLAGGSRIIVTHNHPSGFVDPSDNDIAITKRLIAAAKVLSMTLVEHMIVGRGGEYYSFHASRPELWNVDVGII